MTGRRAPVPIRRRLVASAVLPVVAAAVLIAVPLSIVRVRAIAEAADDALESRATTVALLIGSRLAEGEPVTGAVLGARLPPDTQAAVEFAGERIVAGTPVGEPSRTASSTAIDGVRATLTVDDSGTVDDQRRALLTVTGIALASILINALITLRIARRLAIPIEALAAAANEAGRGSRPPTIARSGIAEIDEVAEAMESTLAQLAARLDDERQLSDAVAHQLRNSLTALRLQVEVAGLGALDDQQHEHLDRITAQIDRFDETIKAMTAVTRGLDADDAEALGPLVTDRAAHWAPSLEAAGRALAVTVDDDAADAAVDPASGREALDVLVENALRHGAGDVRVQARRHGDHAVVVVEDDGPGVPEGMERSVFERGVSAGGGTGLGLALARDLVNGRGGRIELTRPRPARFELWLPTAAADRKDAPWETRSRT